MRKTAAILWATLILAVSYGCSSTSNGGTGAQLPPISADKLGNTCTGFGTSPGDTATFKDSADCQGGYCLVDLTGNDIVSYCTADCDVYSCPSGYVCKAVTLGDAKHACFIDPNAQPDDAGACQQPKGTFTANVVSRDDSGACPVVADSTVSFDPSDAGSACTQKFDPSACTLDRKCSETDSNGTYATEDVVTVHTGGNLTDVLTVKITGSGVDETCVYDITYTRN